MVWMHLPSAPRRHFCPDPISCVLLHVDAPVITQPNASVVPVFRDYQEVLVCEAEGNPKPTITWSFHNKTVYGGNLTINMDMVGEITCLAVNNVNQTIKIVQLVFKGKKNPNHFP